MGKHYVAMEQERAIKWPNGLGMDVGESEVWQARLDGIWGVRCFHNGEAHKWLEINPAEYLFITPHDAVVLCCDHGTIID